MKRDLADMWNLVWELALLVCAGFALLNAFAPPQDLPWKPLDLDRPLGRATTAKVAGFDVPTAATPEAVEGATEACMQALRNAGFRSNARPTATTAASAWCAGRCGSRAAR